MSITPPDLGVLLAATDGPPQLDQELGASTWPLALFPVRLETRFRPIAWGWNELQIRVYPDKVHLDSHDPTLTADELAWGRRYWERWWRADDEAARRDAWRTLAGRFGPERAAWVARALTPTNSAERPAVPPRFPDLGEPATTTRTALARLLPSRWVATAYVGGTVAVVVTGNDIVPDLAVGPDLAAAVAQDALDHEAPAVDEGMAWMIDFERAEQAGMALRMFLTVTGVELLLVTGVRDGDGSAEVAAQLDAHHYGDGLAFLLPATPTNNTAAGRSPWQAPDPGLDRSYDDEWRSQPGEGSAADLATRAFGVPGFGAVAGAADTDVITARAMVTALWPATWGYFLAQMVGFDGPLTVAGRDWARRHAIDHLRPGGPLPLLRCGRQPYGVLPVTSLDRWTPQSGDPDAGAALGLRDLLVSLRDRVWRPASVNVPRVGRGDDDPGADLVDVLQRRPLSSAYLVRGLMGQHFLQHLRAFLGENLDAVGFWQALVQLTGREPERLGLGFTPALAHAAYEEAARPLAVPPVGDPASIGELLAADPDQLAAAPAAPVPLLQALMRHALLRQHAEAAARLLDGPATPFAELIRDPELVDLAPDQPPTPTWSRQRSRSLDGGTVAQRLAADPGPELTELRAALGVLAGADAPTLERHLAGTLDATSHRLDAWVTSLASRRLAEVRARQPAGVTIGGYGWLEGLRMAPGGPAAPATPDEPEPLVTNPDDPGFVHAPSLNQASAAALLRNAHLAHGGGEGDPYAIELSSARVRLARRLFEGVRQGQPLGALLGYRFERTLHEAGVDDFIDDFRALAPLPGAEGTRLVVDGLALSRRWHGDRDSVLDVINRLAQGDPRLDALVRALDGLEATVDAAADAVNAEGAFQLVRGNPARAGASLEAISSGQALPPDLGFVRTPRTGVGLTHRVLMLFAADDQATTGGWATTSPRAAADPVLAAWAGRLLGRAGAAAARVQELGPDGAVSASHEVPLAALGLTAIDLVWATGGVDGPPSEVLARVLDAATAATGGPGPGASLRVELAGLADLVELATRAQRLLAGTRPADGADLQPPHADPERGLDLDEYEGRVAAAEQALAAAAATLEAASGDGLRAAMLQVAAFGVPGAVPAPGIPLETQARALRPELARRLAPGLRPEPADDEARRDQLLERLRAVFGPGFLALPQFTAANAADLAASRADAAALLGGDPLAAYTWMQRMERVRVPLARMGRPLGEAEALGTGVALELTVAQVPHLGGQRWVALAPPEGTSHRDGCVSLVLQAAPAELGGPLCGLQVDEWTEVVPSASETTGIAFQYDPPDAAAPQAILLAVPPVVGEPWRVGTLNRVLLETLDLARLRGVEPGALGDVAHYLPATYLAFNVDNDAVSTDLNPLAP
jgi:hypothetical protein